MEVLLNDVCDIQYGFAFDSKQFSESEGVPVIRIRDLLRGYSETYTTEEFNKEYLVSNGDLLIGMDGEFNIVRWGGAESALNQRVCKLIPNVLIDKDYLYYRMPSVLKAIEAKTPFVTVKHLSAKELNRVSFKLPSLENQKKIASILNKVDYLIEIRKSQLNQMDELVKSRFVEMFGDPVSNSYGLPEAVLSELGELGRGVSKHRPRNDPQLLGGEYPLIQTGDVANAELYISTFNSTYSELGLKQSKMWSKDTLCITIAANIAKTAILQFDACFPDSIVGFSANERTNNIFIHYWFSFFQEILEAQAPESAQKNINLKILSDLKVIVPVKEKQNQFADFVAQVDKSKLAVQKSLEQLEILKKSLMQAYFG